MHMVIKMTRDEVGELVMDILINELGVKPGDIVPFQLLKANYRARNGDSADIKHGLECAVELEWLELIPGSHDLRLTMLGYEAAP
jgi:hypothetical protein